MRFSRRTESKGLRLFFLFAPLKRRRDAMQTFAARLRPLNVGLFRNALHVR